MPGNARVGPALDPAVASRVSRKSALREEILRTIDLPHYFGSAFDREQAHRYLPAKIDRESFDDVVGALLGDGTLTEKSERLYAREVAGAPEEKRACSRDLFVRHRRHLRLLSLLPWVRFMGLTGANAFESCRPEDDLDLFVVTAPERLWITFIPMILWSRAVGRRDLFCINYLVDEDHLRIRHENYYTAVQLMSMVPLCDRGVGARLVATNRWVFEHLPNARPSLSDDPYYELEPRRHDRDPRGGPSTLLAATNRRLYEMYARRLRRKYPQAFGKGIVVGEGVAKLHPVDYGDLYEQIAGAGRRDP